MIYVLALFLPFVALAVKGLYIQAVLNFVLWLVGIFTIFFGIGVVLIIAAIIWGCVAIGQKINKERHEQMIQTLSANNQQNASDKA